MSDQIGFEDISKKDLITELTKSEQLIEELKNKCEKLENTLGMDKKHFRTLVEKAGIAILIDDKDGNFSYFNKTFTKLFGYSSEEIKKKSIRSLVHPDDIDMVLNFHKKRIKGKKPISRYEFRGVRKDGTTIYLEVDSSEEIRGKDIIGTHSYIWDITERKLSEKKRLENEEKLRNIFENSTNLFYSHTTGHILTYLSPQVNNMLGYTMEEAMVNWTELASDNPINEKGFLRTVEAIKSGKSQPPYELELLHKNGKKVRVEVRESPVVKDGKTVAIVGALTDITDRKKAEMIQSTIYHLLKETRTSDSLKSVLKKIHKELNNVMDAKNFYVALYHSKIKKYSLPYHYDKYDDFSDIKYFNLDNSITDYVRRTGSSHLITKEIEEKLSKTSEIDVIGQISKIWMGAPIKDKKDRVIGVIATQNYTDEKAFTDKDLKLLELVADNIGSIIEKKKTEEENRKLEERLKQAQKMEAIGTLAGGIAHDFNNILGVIMGYTELTLSDSSDKKVVENNLKQVLNASYRAKEMVEHILTFSRKSEYTMVSVNIGKIIKETIRFLRLSIPSTIEIKYNIENNLELIFGNPTQINQVLMNLCTNAAYAMKDEGGILEINLIKKNIDLENSLILDIKPGKYQILSVSDSGIGMSKKLKERIFEPYFTTKKSGEGTGMGLAVIYGIVKSHSGEIKVYSELNKGTVFDIYFPVLNAEKTEDSNEDSDLIIKGNNEMILFVDDEASLVELATQILKKLRYRVESNVSSLEALEVFKLNPEKFDLIITDMTMPNMTGIKLASEIRKIKSNIPVIICTGFSDSINKDNFKTFGIDALIMKPIMKKKLASIINRVLKDRKN